MALTPELLLSITGQQNIHMSKSDFESLKLDVPVREYEQHRGGIMGSRVPCVEVPVVELQEALTKNLEKAAKTPVRPPTNPPANTPANS